MSNGYGGSSDNIQRSTTNAQGQVAPPGFHYMPDGTLMSDVEHARLFGSAEKVITAFNIDFSDLPATAEERDFEILGDDGASFSLEVKADRSGIKYYNFYDNTFTSTTVKKLEGTITNGAYRGKIKFPAVTGSDDQYDIALSAFPGTKHAAYSESRFRDGSLDLNGSSGSNSLVMNKVIHQRANVTLTITPFTPAGTTDLIKASTRVDKTITCGVGKRVDKQSFSISCEVNAATKSYRITKQPVVLDIIGLTSLTVGSAPETLPGENIYPSVTNTDTVDGAVSEADKIVMDTNVADKMEVGDRVTGTGLSSSTVFTVRALNPDGDNAKEFQISQAVSLDDGVTLSFSNQMNYQWPLDNIERVKENMIVYAGDNVTTDSSVAKYEDSVTLFEGTFDEEILIKNSAPFKDTKNQTPTVAKGKVTVQPGNVVFDKQQKLALAGDTIRIGGYGLQRIFETTGYELLFSNLKIELTTITTTTTSAVNNSTSVPVASRNGILDSVSTVSGIGINPALANPTVSSGAGAVSGAGTVVLSAAQTLEDGITLTFSGAGQVATITGDVEVVRAGDADATIRFDMDRLLSIT
tara:strand:- start:3 stop:1745 length:1743 start_codon:yes stop_codon:yes gene_type:complete